MLERLLSKQSKYPPDVKTITLGGPLLAQKNLLCSGSNSMKEFFFPNIGSPPEVLLPSRSWVIREASTLEEENEQRQAWPS